MLLRVKQGVENVGGSVLGVVLNQVDIGSDASYGYYTSYYSYYSPQGASKKAAKKKTVSSTSSVAPEIAEPEPLAAAADSGSDVF